MEIKAKHDPDRLGSAPIGKLLLEFGIPATIGLIVQALYNVVDSIFIGQGVGGMGIAAVTVANPIMMIMMAIGVLIGGGGNALMAIRLGQGRRKQAEVILGNALTLVIIMAVVVGVLGLIFIEPILRFSGATPEVMPYAKSFVSIILLGFLPQGIGFGLNNFIRTVGNPKRAMSTMLVGAIVNTVLNYLFVIVLKWGMVGSASATVIGQTVSMILVLRFFTSDISPIRLRLPNIKLDWVTVSTMLPLGIGPFAMHLAASVVNLVQNNALVVYGAFDPVGSDGALAGIGVVLRLIMFFTMPIFGFVLAAQPIIGFNTGAKQWSRVRRAWTVSVTAATATLVVLWITVQAFPGFWVSLFGIEEPGIRDLAIYGLRAMLILMPAIGFQMLGANYFQATGQAMKAAVLSLTRQVLFYIPALLLLPRIIPTLFPQTNALHGVLYAMPVADFLSVAVTAYFVIRELKKLSTLKDGDSRGGEKGAHRFPVEPPTLEERDGSAV